jgi:integrase
MKTVSPAPKRLHFPPRSTKPVRTSKKKRGVARIPAGLLPHLVRARRRGTDLGYVIHDNGARIKDIKKGFAAACKRAGLEGVKPHTLKHTATTWLMQAGVPFFEASGYLSTSVETLQKVYAHHCPDFQKQAADAIGRRPKVGRGMGA